MLELCDILGISVNELLSGEKINMENNNQKNEQLLLDMAKELEKQNKTVWSSMWIILVFSTIALLGGLAVSIFLIPKGMWTLVAIEMDYSSLMLLKGLMISRLLMMM